jgi:hypothetical protein
VHQTFLHFGQKSLAIKIGGEDLQNRTFLSLGRSSNGEKAKVGLAQGWTMELSRLSLYHVPPLFHQVFEFFFTPVRTAESPVVEPQTFPSF